jgi:hypothetical protein
LNNPLIGEQLTAITDGFGDIARRLGTPVS